MEKKAFAYLRVSGLGQVAGDGFPRQTAAISKYAAAHELKVVRTFREEGVCGASELENRAALQSLLAALTDSDVCVVIIERLDRLARDLMVQETIIGDFRKRGIELISTAEPDLCSDDPSRKLMRQIFGAIAEYDRAMVVLKLRGARQRMKTKTGRCEGRKAYGARPGEAETISRIRALRNAGTPLAHIAAQLNAEGIAPRAGSAWHPTQVSRILARAAQ